MFQTNSLFSPGLLFILFALENKADPSALQLLPNVLQTYKYLQVDNMPVQIIRTFSSPLNIPHNNTSYSALLLTHYFLF